MLRGVRLLGLLAVVVRVVRGDEVAPVRHRVEAHRVEVGDGDLVTGAGERLGRRLGHGAAEAPWLRVGVDDEDAQSGSPLLAPVAQIRSFTSRVMPPWPAIPSGLSVSTMMSRENTATSR